MARLPTEEQLGLRVAQDRSNVVTGNFSTAGAQQLGQAAASFGQSIKLRQDAMNLQKAKTFWAKKKLEADNAFDQDNDFETFVDRYDKTLGKAEEEALGMLSSPRMKELFKMDVELSRAQGLESMKDFAFKKEAESGLASLQEIIATNREIALNAKSDLDRASAFDTINDAIETAKLNTYIDADTAQNMRQKVAIDAAIGTIQVQDLRTQRAMLSENKGPASLIPTDTRKTMLEQVNNRLVNQEGMEQADRITKQGGSLSERLSEVKAIKDVDIRQAAQRQVEHDFAMEKTARLETQAGFYDEGRKALNSGLSINQWIQANPNKWDAMSGDQQTSLLTAGNKQFKTDRQAYVNFMEMARTDLNQAKDYLYENSAKFDTGDFEKFVGMVNKPQELDGFLTRSQRFNSKLEPAGIKKDSDLYAEAQQALDKDVMNFQKAQGRDPTAKELDEMMNIVFDKTVDTVWLNPFTRDQYGFNLSQEERQSALNKNVMNRKMEKFEQILQQVESELSGPDEIPVVLTEEEKAQYWINAERMGLLDD